MTNENVLQGLTGVSIEVKARNEFKSNGKKDGERCAPITIMKNPNKRDNGTPVANSTASSAGSGQNNRQSRNNNRKRSSNNSKSGVIKTETKKETGVTLLKKNNKDSQKLQKVKEKHKAAEVKKVPRKDLAQDRPPSEVVRSTGKPKEARRPIRQHGDSKHDVDWLEKELARAKNEVEKERKYRSIVQQMLTGLREEFECEQRLRISIQDDLTKSNDALFLESSKRETLEAELEFVTSEKESLLEELREVKERLDMEQNLRKRTQDDLSTVTNDLSMEKERSEELSKRLKLESAANVVIRMELQSARAKLNPVSSLEEDLRQEKTRVNELKMEVANNTALKIELQAAKDKLVRVGELERALMNERAKAKERDQNLESLMGTMKKAEKLRQEKDKYLQRLKTELVNTRSKLLHEKRKKGPKKLSLEDWVEKPPLSDLEEIDLEAFDELNPAPAPPAPATSVSMPPRIETSLPGAATSTCATDQASLPQAVDATLYFDGVGSSNGLDIPLEPLEDELVFIRSAYSKEEINIDGNKVSYRLTLPMENEAECIMIDLSVTIPEGYPTSGVLAVGASLNEESNCSPEVRRCAIDAMPKLVEVCTWEAQGNEGSEALLCVFNVADSWAKSDWHGILSSKQIFLQKSASQSTDDENDVELCVLLVFTHHIESSACKGFQLVKKMSSKLSLGGVVKFGKPGLILVEGSEADCEFMMESLAQSRKQLRNLTFSTAGKVIRKVNDATFRLLPKKLEQLESRFGMEKIKEYCQELGLMDSLDEACQR